MKKNKKMGLSPAKITLNFKTDLDHCLDTKKYISGTYQVPIKTHDF